MIDVVYQRSQPPWSQRNFPIKRSVSSGLGYVGLPLAEAFSRHLMTICYRRNQKAVDELNATPGNRIEATTDPSMIKQADFVIIGDPTPVTKAKDPDLEPVESASKIVGQNLK